MSQIFYYLFYNFEILKYRRWYPISPIKSILFSLVQSKLVVYVFFVRRAGLMRSQQDSERWWFVPFICAWLYMSFFFILFDLCLFITIFNFILNYILIVTFWIFTYYNIWIMLIIYYFIWNYWIFLFCNMFGSVLECYELTGIGLLWPWLIKWK